MTETAADLKYWAFISYSHADEAWARWLHTSLETWKVPPRLVGRPLGAETVPRKLFPIFRDRDELPSAHELGAVIERALRQSRALIVICSPRSATSRWVNEEIKAFRALGRSTRVFCLIVDGEPHASARPEIAFSECFPPALRTEGFEPIAADAREGKDGKAGARLKLLAGILDVGLDELRQREKQRELRRRLLAVATVLAVVAALGGLARWFLVQREARETEIRIEKLVENGRLELLDGRNARAAVYLTEALKLGYDTVPLRYMLARAMEPLDALTAVRFHHGGTVLRAAFSPDGNRVVMAVRIKDQVVGKVYDTTTGSEVRQFSGLPRHPRVLRFFSDGRRIYASGFQKLDDINGYIEDEPITTVWGPDAALPALLLAGNAGRDAEPLHPDGRHFLAAAKGGGIEIRDVTGRDAPRRIAPGKVVTACSFSLSGLQIISADESGRVEIWDFASGRRLAGLAGAENLFAVSASFFPDGKQAMVTTDSGDVRIWNLADGKLRLAFLADPQTILQTQLSDDGRRLLTVGPDGYKVWSTSRGLLALSINRPLLLQAAQRSAGAVLSADGNFLYTADNEASFAEVWSVLSKAKLYTLDLHIGPLNSVALDRSNGHILTASGDGNAELWKSAIRPAWGRELIGINPYAVRFAADGTSVLVGGGTPEFAFLELLGDGQSRAQFSGHRSQIWDLAFDADRRHFLTAGHDGSARWWDSARTKTLLELRDAGDPLHLSRISFDGRRAVTASGYFRAGSDGPSPTPRCVLWNLQTGKLQAVLDEALVNEHAVAFSASGLLAVGDDAGLIRLRRADDGGVLHELRGHTAAVRSVGFSADGGQLVSAADDKTVRIWNVSDGLPLAALTDSAVGSPYHATFSPQGDVVSVATQEGTVWLWSPESGSLRALKGHSNTSLWSRYLRGGQLLLSGSLDGSVRAWDPATGQELGKAAVNRFEVVSYDVNPDETRLTTSSKERYVSSWDIGVERRTAAELAAALPCRSPWSIEGDQAKPRPITSEGCPPPH